MDLGLVVRIVRIIGPEGDAARGEIAALLIPEKTCRSAACCEKAIPSGLYLPSDNGLLSCRRERRRPHGPREERGEGEAEKLGP